MDIVQPRIRIHLPLDRLLRHLFLASASAALIRFAAVGL